MNPNSPNQQPVAPGTPQYGVTPAMPPAPGTMPMPQPGQPIGAPAPMAMPAPPAPGAVAQAPFQPGATYAAAPGQPQVVQGGGQPGAAPGPGTKPVPTITNPNSTQNILQIAEIRDGIVIMNDGSFRSVVMVNSINFDLMSRAEQEAVEFSYQSFLNSLYYPIQIFIRSQKVDMGPYIEKLDKVRSEHDNMLLALLMDDYVDYIEALSQQTNIMDKKFYIVIPFFPKTEVKKTFTQSKNFLTGFTALFSKQDQHVVINEDDLEKAKSELRNRVQTVLDGLMQCGIQSLPLDTEELIELYYDTYNPDTATRQQLKNFDEMQADIVTKGEGMAAQPNLERELI